MRPASVLRLPPGWIVFYGMYSAAFVVVAAARRFEPSGYEKGGGSLLRHFIELAILAISRRNLRRVMNVLSLSFKSRSDLADATDLSRRVCAR